MVVFSLEKYLPPKFVTVKIANASDEYEYNYSKYYQKIIKDYVYYSGKRVIA
jgi:hypothetical protein